MKKTTEYSRVSRQETRDFSVGTGPSKEKKQRIDLGLALLSRAALPGVRYTAREIAAWCGCTDSAIQNIERRALLKLRNALMFRDRDLCAALFMERGQ